MSKILTAGMKRRATYESLVRDTILEPKDKIKLPNREASILRRTQQLSRYDDDDFLGLETINEKINKERIQQIELLKLIAQKPMGTMSIERARQYSGSDDDFKMLGEADIDLENEIAKHEAILSDIQKSETDEYVKHKQAFLKQAERGIETASIAASHMKPSSTTPDVGLATKILTNTLSDDIAGADPKYMKRLDSDIKARSSSSKDVPKETIPLISSSAASASLEDTPAVSYESEVQTTPTLSTEQIIKLFNKFIGDENSKKNHFQTYLDIENLLKAHINSKPKSRERKAINAKIIEYYININSKIKLK